MALVLDQSKLQDRNYVSGFFDLLAEFVKDCGEVLSTVRIQTKSPFVPSLGSFTAYVERNLRLHPKAFLHSKQTSSYRFLAQVSSYSRDSGKLEFEVLAIDYDSATTPYLASLQKNSEGKFVTELSPSGVILTSSNAVTSPVPVANGGTGNSNTEDFIEVSFASFLENHRISTQYIHEDFLSLPQSMLNWTNSIGTAPRNSSCGSPVEIVGNYRTNVGSSSSSSPPATFGGSTMGRRSGFIELLVGGSNPASAAVYLGRSCNPTYPDDAVGTLGTFDNAYSNANNLAIGVDFLLPAASTAGERYLIEVGLVSSFGASMAGMWASYVDNENSNRPVLKSRENYFGSLLTSNSGSLLLPDVWHSLNILSSGTSFSIDLAGHSVTRAINNQLTGYFMLKITKLTGSAQSSVVIDFVSYRRNTLLAGRRA